MKLLWLGYIIYSFDNCVIKLCIETDLSLGMHMAKRCRNYRAANIDDSTHLDASSIKYFSVPIVFKLM